MGSKTFNPTKSYYLPNDNLSIEMVRDALPEAIIKTDRNGDWDRKAIIHHRDVEAVLVSKKGARPTHYSKVHFSDKGLHTVPTPDPN